MLNELTTALRTAIAAAPGLAGVWLTPAREMIESAQLPAATLTLTNISDGRVGNDPDALWGVRFELTLFRRDASRQANAEGLLALADAAIARLLADPTQGGRAVPGPNGLATEVARVEPGRAALQAPPINSITLEITCWLIPPAGLAAPEADRVLIDGQALLASGPHRLTFEGWERRRLDRQFAGLNGTVTIDLGITRRAMTLAGRLVAASRSGLTALMNAVATAVDDGQLHAMSASGGLAFANVRIERIRWGAVLSPAAAAVSCVGYRIEMAQIG